MRNPVDLLNGAGEPMPQPSALNASAKADALAALFAQVGAAPHRHDFFQLMRRVEALTPGLPRLGHASRPSAEPLRLAQAVSLAFAPAPLASLTRTDEHGTPIVPRLAQHFFGLLGPNGPLPLHLTDFARERILHHGDPTFSRLLDMLSHRFLLLFYRAASQGRPVNQLDRPDGDRFAFYVGSLIGLADSSCRQRDAASDRAKLHFAGLLNMQTRPPEVLETLVRAVLRVPARIEPFCGHWMTLEPGERTALHTQSVHPRRRGNRTHIAQLGCGAVLGSRVWDRQHKFRLVIGPLSLAQYEAFLPGGAALATLVALVRQQLNRELTWDAQLVLRANEVPTVRLGRHGALGYSAWLANHRRRVDAADLALDADARVPL